MTQLYLKCLITKLEVPFINASEATKRPSDQTEKGKCTNVTNHISHEGQSTPFLHFKQDLMQLKDTIYS